MNELRRLGCGQESEESEEFKAWVVVSGRNWEQRKEQTPMLQSLLQVVLEWVLGA